MATHICIHDAGRNKSTMQTSTTCDTSTWIHGKVLNRKGYHKFVLINMSSRKQRRAKKAAGDRRRRIVNGVVTIGKDRVAAGLEKAVVDHHSNIHRQRAAEKPREVISARTGSSRHAGRPLARVCTPLHKTVWFTGPTMT